MDIVVDTKQLTMGGDTFRCTIGRGGFSRDKREGDGATPIGRYQFREVLYRADRVPKPLTGLPVRAITQNDGWCDDTACPEYNHFVQLPFKGSHEELWREDHLYDLLAVIGYNDDPVVAGAGSAIFLHVAAPNFTPTQGCVGLELHNLQKVIEQLTLNTVIVLSE
ncbi:MAG TPA: L,D-transpeptidase family protein [Oculatellaceae cyanobacterium]